jgi:hypothetical protein
MIASLLERLRAAGPARLGLLALLFGVTGVLLVYALESSTRLVSRLGGGPG